MYNCFEEFGTEKITIYNLKKQKDKLLKLYTKGDHKKLTQNRKTQGKKINKQKKLKNKKKGRT